jgi:sugar lactone lactonase YvrE
MNTTSFRALIAFAGGLLPLSAQEPAPPETPLWEVASFPSQQVTGITVSKTGRTFVNFPFWSDGHTTSVAELDAEGRAVPFPNEPWNAKEGDPAKRWVCVQSVVVDDSDALWVLDTGSPRMEGVIEGGAKLVRIDLKSNAVTRTIPFPAEVAPKMSYLNDVRFDHGSRHAFLTESGLGALIVVDLETGKARRVLANHFSTKAEPVDLEVDGVKLIDPKTGKAPAIHADGIALDISRKTLYFHALTGRGLYKVSTEDLLNEQLSEQDMGAKVAKIAETPKADGMLGGPGGVIYLTAIEENAIYRFDPATGSRELVVKDDLLQWPDTMAWGPGRMLYVTTSQIHRMPKYNGGESRQVAPFRVLRLAVNIPEPVAPPAPAEL